MTNYISYVLENNLAISKFALDHAIILLALISYNDDEIRDIYEKEQLIYEKILMSTINFSYNRISMKFIESNILITDYTNLMERKTCELFKIKENTNINCSCQDLIINSKNSENLFAAAEYLEVKKLNNILLEQLKASFSSLNQLHKKISAGIVTLFFAESFIEHLISETEIYIYTLDFLKRQMTFTPTYTYKCKYYFNVFLKQHATYLKNMIFPINFKFYDEVDAYINDFQEIADEFDDNVSPKIMHHLNNQTKETTERFINYNTQLIQNMLYNKFYASAIPLLSDHILRESNYVTYQLDIFNYLS